MSLNSSTLKPKKPWLAVLLNAVPVVMGLGYLYLGRWAFFWTVFGLQVVLGFFTRNEPRLTAALILIWLASMAHVYRVASSHNARIGIS